MTKSRSKDTLFNLPHSKKTQPEMDGNIEVDIRMANDYTTRFESIYYLNIYSNQPKDVLEKVLTRYDLNITPSVLKHKPKVWIDELTQQYQRKHVGQLAHLINYLLEEKIITREQIKDHQNILPSIKACADSEITALFSGEPLTREYAFRHLELPYDPYYDSSELGRTHKDECQMINWYNRELHETISTKLASLYKSNAIPLLSELIESARKVLGLFNQEHHEKLAQELDRYQHLITRPSLSPMK